MKPINALRVAEKAKQIASRQKALSWLTEYGVKLTGKRDADEAIFEVRLRFAGSCEGASEAAGLIESYARVHLPEIVRSAIECCGNDIAMAASGITEELEQVT